MSRSNQLGCYLGRLTREKADEYLQGRKAGTYLIRDSISIPGDYALSVSESGKVSHYIINNKGIRYQIGEQTFSDLPAIIEFYKHHFLDSTNLLQPLFKVQAQYAFVAKDAEDLSFNKGDMLVVIEQNEENWWTAVNDKGDRGLIPQPYVKKLVDPQQQQQLQVASPAQAQASLSSDGRPSQSPNQGNNNRVSCPAISSSSRDPVDHRRISQPNPRPTNPLHTPGSGPLYVRAIRQHLLPYDDSKLSFEKGDVIKVIKKQDNGLWFGQKGDRTGYFQFYNYVEILEPSEGREGWNGTV